MAFSRCKFCGKPDVFSFPLLTKKGSIEYFRCKYCEAISLSSKEYLTYSQQLLRYQQHNNDLRDLGYAKFLASFLTNTFSFLPALSFSSILDYGSGPNPALIQLLHSVCDNQKKQNKSFENFCFDNLNSLEQIIDFLSYKISPLPDKVKICGWDPFFSPVPQNDCFSLVLCLEVAEHFENPWEGFAGLSQSCLLGGYVAVGTLPIPDSIITNEDFKGWWYKDDRTHVSFYTEKAMIECGKSCGLSYIGKASPRIFIFKKTGDA